MASLKNSIMLSCKKATELIAKKEVVGLDPFQNMQLSMHLMMCKACKNYENQSRFLDELVSHQLKRTTGRSAEQENETEKEALDLKEHIVRLLQKKSH